MVKKNKGNDKLVSARVTHYEKIKIDKATINSHAFLKLGIKSYYENKTKSKIELKIDSLTYEIEELKEKREFIDFKIKKRKELKEELIFKLNNIKENNSSNSIDQDSDEWKAVEIIHNAFKRKIDFYNDLPTFLDDITNKEFLTSIAAHHGFNEDELKNLAMNYYKEG
jgi:FtsZ-binding cell division protein ZapB